MSQTLEEVVLEVLKEGGEMQAADIVREAAERFDTSESVARNALSQLKKQGRVERVSRGRYVLPARANATSTHAGMIRRAPAGKAEVGQVVDVPLVSVRAAAGDGEEVFQEEVVRFVSYDRTSLIRELGVRPEDLVIITVTGNSMVPTLAPGDRILVEIYRGGPVVDGGIYVFRGNYNGVLVKRVHWTPDGTMLLRSDNPDAPNFTIGPEEDHALEVAGRVVKVEKNV